MPRFSSFSSIHLQVALREVIGLKPLLPALWGTVAHPCSWPQGFIRVCNYLHGCLISSAGVRAILEQACVTFSRGHRVDSRSLSGGDKTWQNSNDTFISEFSLRNKINSSKMLSILGHNNESVLISFLVCMCVRFCFLLSTWNRGNNFFLLNTVSPELGMESHIVSGCLASNSPFFPHGRLPRTVLLVHLLIPSLEPFPVVV